jgi:hypothetical protein
MHYEVFSIRGASTGKRGHNQSEVAEEITDIYELAARRGGRIVTGHTLACEETQIADENPASSLQPRGEYVFLVAELPGDIDNTDGS